MVCFEKRLLFLRKAPAIAGSCFVENRREAGRTGLLHNDHHNGSARAVGDQLGNVLPRL